MWRAAIGLAFIQPNGIHFSLWSEFFQWNAILHISLQCGQLKRGDRYLDTQQNETLKGLDSVLGKFNKKSNNFIQNLDVICVAKGGGSLLNNYT